MNGEFHYYWTHILAVEAGFTETDAGILAVAAQYPDENIEPVRVRTPDGAGFDSVVTHHYGFWSTTAHREILVPFHFIPGDQAAAAALRSDAFPAPWTVTPKSPLAKRVLIDALKTRSLYRIGIALHAYADTWAHQNFSGLRHRGNQHPTAASGSLLPPIGHAQYGVTPDILHAVWSDPRLQPGQQRISNRDRFFAAAEMIYRYLCTFHKHDWDDWFLVRDRIEALIGPAGSEHPAEERLLNYQIEYGVLPLERHAWKSAALQQPPTASAAATPAAAAFAPGSGHTAAVQEKLRWFRDELLERSSLRERKPATAAPGFFQSHWYRWMLAAAEHRHAVLSALPADKSQA